MNYKDLEQCIVRQGERCVKRLLGFQQINLVTNPNIVILGGAEHNFPEEHDKLPLGDIQEGHLREHQLRAPQFQSAVLPATARDPETEHRGVQRQVPETDQTAEREEAGVAAEQPDRVPDQRVPEVLLHADQRDHHSLALLLPQHLVQQGVPDLLPAQQTRPPVLHQRTQPRPLRTLLSLHLL